MPLARARLAVFRPPEAEVKPLFAAAGGLSDRLWRVDADARWCGVARNVDVCSVMVRRHAEGSELLIDRTVERAVATALSREGFDDVERVGSFANGRVDTWPEGWAVLSDKQALNPLVLNGVAAQLALLHRQTLTVPGLSFRTQTDLSTVKPVLWKNLRRLLKLTKSVAFPEGIGGRAGLLRRIGLSGMKAAIDRLENRWNNLARTGSSSSSGESSKVQAVRFSHNNLDAGSRSIMIRSDMRQTDADWPRVTLSEFAHADYNFRASDIAEFFNSLAGPGCDWEKVPSGPVQQAWIARCLASSAERNAAYTMAAAEMLYKEVQLLGLVSHLSRCLLGVLNAAATDQRQSEAAEDGPISGSGADFDWLVYASQRRERFRVERPRVFARLAGKKPKHEDL